MPSANISSGTLYVSGFAVTTYVGYRVDIRIHYGPPTVNDSDLAQTLIPVTGDSSEVRDIDVSGLSGNGANVLFSYNGRSKVTGSNQNDLISVGGLGNKKIIGRGGDDALLGGNGNDLLSGGDGDDRMQGEHGNDRIRPGRGDDYIEGGSGVDTLILAGNAADYEVRVVDKLYQISHLGGAGFDGTNTFIEIERLQFADQTVVINTVPTLLIAEVLQNTLFITGEVGNPNSPVGRYVFIEHTGDIRVYDNVLDWKYRGAVVDVRGDTTAIQDIDARGVSGRGVEIDSDYQGPNRIHGSDQSDLIRTHDGGDGTRIFGHGGQDRILGYDGNDILRGGTGNDFLSGGRGDDRIRGQKGSDEIDGGEGSDTLIFSGNESEYEIDIVDGRYRISHLGGSGYDGVDYFFNIEYLQFADQVVEITEIPTNLRAEVSGDTLVVSGASAQSFPGIRVEIRHYNSTITVLDNRGRSGDLTQSVPITGNLGDVLNIDVRQMTGGGADIASLWTTGNIWGSPQSDRLYTGGSKSVAELYGFDGDDSLIGSDHPDLLVGGTGNDSLFGGKKRDKIMGEQGSDFINGGDGKDTLIFKGPASEYKLIATGSEGGYQISHLGGSGFDGIDEFYQIEVLQFSDQTLNIGDWGILL
jgi:Ca2+-binding RTX toxin-like protein